MFHHEKSKKLQCTLILTLCTSIWATLNVLPKDIPSVGVSKTVLGRTMPAKWHWVNRFSFHLSPISIHITSQSSQFLVKTRLYYFKVNLSPHETYTGKRRCLIFPKSLFFSCHHSLQSNRDEIPQESKYFLIRAKQNKEGFFFFSFPQFCEALDMLLKSILVKCFHRS